MAAHLPKLSHILETILYTKNLPAATTFYSSTLGLTPIPGFASDRGQGYQLGTTNLLIFALGKTTEDVTLKPSDTIPRHGPSEHIIDTLLERKNVPADAKTNSLRQHYCLAAATDEDVKAWEKYLIEKGTPIIGRVNWPQGGYSIYFHDPDEHVGEIVSRGIWPNWR